MKNAVVVVGSLHYDILLDAPDRPRKGETVAGRSWAPKFGGKGGNQAIAARRQGVPTSMVGAVGDDDFGIALLAGLDRAEVERSAVTTLTGVGSGMSVAIFDDQGDYGAVIVSGANLAIRAGQASDTLLRSAEVLILQNEIPEEVNDDVAGRAKRLGVTTILNAAPAREFKTSLPHNIDFLIVNTIEAEMLGSQPVGCLTDAAKAAEFLASRYAAVVVTAGGDGVTFHSRAGQRLSLPGIPVEVRSTHGAGDMFVGTFAARLAMRDNLQTALRLANQEAARLVSTPEKDRQASLPAPRTSLD